jgi:uncharacterized LabA/DUF88 family protein
MRTYIYIDASNLFHGGVKSLGWHIDYQKFHDYLRTRYDAQYIGYFGGVQIHKYPFSYLDHEYVAIDHLTSYYDELISLDNDSLSDTKLILVNRYRNRAKFLRKLKSFGYSLYLKPIKTYIDDEGNKRIKANCDIDMVYRMLMDIDQYDRIIFLSGDGDFLPILKHMRNKGKEVLIFARGNRTAKELKQFAGSMFIDFSNNLRSKIEQNDNEVRKVHTENGTD